jgi:hypothetical protein
VEGSAVVLEAAHENDPPEVNMERQLDGDDNEANESMKVQATQIGELTTSAKVSP